jgi:predicted RNA methylase
MAPKLRDLIQELREVKTWEKPKVELEQYPTPPDIAAHMLFAADDEGDVEDALVADLGCGGCVLGIAAALMGAAHVTGFDIDPEALKVAAENVAEAEVSVDLVECDVTQLATRGNGERGDGGGGGAGHRISGGEAKADGSETATSAAAAAEAAFPSFIQSIYTTKVEYANAKGAAVEAARALSAGAPSATTVVSEPDSRCEEDAPPTQLPIGCGAFDLVLMNPPFGTQKGSNGVDMRFLRVGLALCAADGAVYSLNKTSTRSFIAKTAASWGAPTPRPHLRLMVVARGAEPLCVRAAC